MYNWILYVLSLINSVLSVLCWQVLWFFLKKNLILTVNLANSSWDLQVKFWYYLNSKSGALLIIPWLFVSTLKKKKKGLVHILTSL